MTDKYEIQHISLCDAIILELIKEDSPVKKFFDLNIGQDLERNFNLVIYAGSEMIGPSVQVAELTGCITEELMGSADYDEHSPFCFLDIFSGSSSTSVPSVKCFGNRKNEKHINVFRIDQHRPRVKEDYLKILFNDEKNIHLAEGENDYYKPLNVFNDINNGDISKIFSENNYDMCIADPPHYLTLKFLDGIGRLLKQKVKVFVLYYAHKEQKNLCKKISSELNKYFDNVYRVFVGSEEMAVCFDNDNNTIKKNVKAGIKKFKTYFKENYDKKNKLDISHELLSKTPS